MSPFDTWLESLDLGKYRELFRENAIDFDVIGDLTEAELRELGLPLGDRKRLAKAIARLEDGESPATAAPPSPPAPAEQPRADDELRQLTLMFVDLVGSTQLANELSLEEYRETLQLYQNECLSAIRKHFGYAAQFQGDGVVAYFGYPAAAEDDAERAVLAGFAIARAVGEIITTSGKRLSARVGIATGDVLIGDIMDGGRAQDISAMGDVPNLAARLQAVAEPGQVIVSERTRRILGNNFDCRRLGEFELKGFSGRVPAWVIVSARATELKFEARQHGALSPLIGREQESQLLSARWADARRGEGQAVLISGEAGIGKSRLAEALTADALQKDAIRLTFQCSPYHRSSAFYPITLHLSQAFGLEPSDPPDVKIGKLRGALERVEGMDDETLSVYAELLSILPHDGATERTPDVLKDKIYDTILQHLNRISRQKPVMILFEDLHWIDPSSEELLDRLIQGIHARSVLLLCTFRPDYKTRWTGQARVTTLPLARLDLRGSRALIDRLDRAHEMPDQLAEKIVARAEGVPLFVEEMVRMVLGEQLLKKEGTGSDRELQLPSSLKDLLRAKIDQLPTARDIVCVCAAIGRSFTTRMVSAVSQNPRDVTHNLLEQLVDTQILVPRSADSEERYAFRHALIQDAAYEAMLPRRARELHRRIAQIFVAEFPVLAAQRPEVVAQHLHRGELFDEAREAWERAARTAMARFASREAVAHLNAAIEANARSSDEGALPGHELRLREALIVALEVRSWGSPEILDNLNRMHELQKATGTPRDIFLVLHGLCGTHLIAGNPDQAETYCRQMEALLAEQDPPEAAMATLAAHNSGMTALFLGRFDAAVRYFDQAIAFCANANLEEIYHYYPANPAGIDAVMRVWARALEGSDPDAVHRALPEVITMMEKEENDFSRCYALSIIASTYQALGRPAEALDFAERALAMSQQIPFEYWEAWSKIVLGWARSHQGAPMDGIAMLSDGLERYQQTGSTQIVTYAQTLLADCRRVAGQTSQAMTQIDEVRAALSTSPIHFHDRLTDEVATKLEAR